MSGFGFGNQGTEFSSILPPPGDALKDYDNTKPHNQQADSIPQTFIDAMSVREEVYAEQGVPLEAEFDEDDARSWHWVVYASVGQTSTPSRSSSSDMSAHSASSTRADDARRASATAARVAVGTIRLIPPPHGPNPYIETADHRTGERHSDADPPPNADKKHPTEPYIKLGRLAVLAPYRSLGLSKLLVNTALDYASKHSESIRPPISPTTMEHANLRGQDEDIIWKGLAMVHAQTTVAPLWKKHGFSEELIGENGEVEISKEERWIEEGIEHMGMWKRLRIDAGRL
jgi:predicted GNAT family N-acyltransferase